MNVRGSSRLIGPGPRLRLDSPTAITKLPKTARALQNGHAERSLGSVGDLQLKDTSLKSS